MGQASSSKPSVSMDGSTVKKPESSKPSVPMDGSTVKKPEQVEVEYEESSPRYSFYNTEELQQGIDYLDEHGYAIFSNVLSNTEVNNSVDLLWKFLENLKSPYHIRRNDPKTWDQPWPGIPNIGLLNNRGTGQAEFMWSVRGNPNIKKVFSQIWNSNELCVSFDGAGCFRNWHLNSKWKTAGGWYHCDQNPFRKPTRCSIQGLVALTDSDESTGGLVVVPGSHKRFLELRSTTSESRQRGDFVRIPYEYPLLEELHPRLIKCQAGDLILWDSRSIHCNTPALVSREKSNQSEFLRVAAYVCMSPISMFVPNEAEYESLEEFRRLREKFVRDRISCTHWPLELVDSSQGLDEEKIPMKLTAYQHSLIIGTNVEPENGTAEIVF